MSGVSPAPPAAAPPPAAATRREWTAWVLVALAFAATAWTFSRSGSAGADVPYLRPAPSGGGAPAAGGGNPAAPGGMTLEGTSFKVRSLAKPVRAFEGGRVFASGGGGGAKVLDRSTSARGERPPQPCTVPLMGVVTTIFGPSESATQLAESHPDVPLLVIGDRKGPATWPAVGPKVRYVPASEQERWLAGIAGDASARVIAAFAARVPWNHFGRKNVGYLMAVQAGACAVWDFDDDNVYALEGVPLLEAAAGAVAPVSLWDSANYSAPAGTPAGYIGVRQRDAAGAHAVNVLTALSPSRYVWPRGFPLDAVDGDRKGNGPTVPELVRLAPAHADDIVVLQAQARGDPDVDAAFRLTTDGGGRSVTYAPTQPATLLAPGAFAPYNAQATMQRYAGFAAMYLPMTVHGRVSDIWRSYIAETVFGVVGLHVAFVPPWVMHDRVAHDLRGDLLAERDLYELTSALLAHLAGWRDAQLAAVRKGESLHIGTLLERLYIDLYEHGVLGADDVAGMQAWLTGLRDVGYRFPAPLAAGKAAPEPSAAVLSPPRPAPLDVHAAFHVGSGLHRVVPLLHAAAAAQFASVSYHVEYAAGQAPDAAPVPFPHLTYTSQAVNKFPGYVGYATFLRAWASRDAQAASAVLWQHDDALPLHSAVAAWLADAKSCTAGMPATNLDGVGYAYSRREWREVELYRADALAADRRAAGVTTCHATPGVGVGANGTWWGGQSDAWALRRECAGADKYVALLEDFARTGAYVERAVPTARHCAFPDAAITPWWLHSDFAKWNRTNPAPYVDAYATGRFQQLHPLKITQPAALLAALTVRDGEWAKAAARRL